MNLPHSARIPIRDHMQARKLSVFLQNVSVSELCLVESKVMKIHKVGQERGLRLHGTPSLPIILTKTGCHYIPHNSTPPFLMKLKL
jgi:hypothetical protein